MAGSEKKPVYQYKANTKELINKFESITQASRMTGIPKSNISKNCRKEIKTIGNYIFSFFKLENANTRNSTNRADKKYNWWIEEVIGWQRVDLYAKDIDDIRYESYLNRFEERVNDIYNTIEDDEECFKSLDDLAYDYFTYYDYEEIVLGKQNWHMNKYKNQYLLLGYDIDKLF